LKWGRFDKFLYHFYETLTDRNLTGTDFMTLKILSTKKWQKKAAHLTQIAPIDAEILFATLVFKKNAGFSAENYDHSIDSGNQQTTPPGHKHLRFLTQYNLSSQMLSTSN
jgi:hypothetical protein